MTHFSRGLDLIHALLTTAKKNISKKPEEYRPIYSVYYMIIYVAIQDSFSYQKCNTKLKGNYRHIQKYRNKQISEARDDAREWLLNSEDFEKMWSMVSGMRSDIMRESLEEAYEDMNQACAEDTGFNSKYHLSVDISRRLKGLSL